MLVCIGGCQSTSAPGKAFPPTPEQVAAIRAELQSTTPAAVLGVVSEALPDERYVAVKGLPSTESFRAGQFVSFTDSHLNAFAFGQVRRVLPDAIHVQYQDPGSNGRAPQVGDIMIRFKP